MSALWLSWTIAALAMIASILLAIELRGRIQNESRIRSDTAGLTQHRGVPTKKGRPLLLVTGDSRAAAIGDESLGRFTIENRGLPGQTSIELVARIGRDLAQLKPDHVVVIIGVNDIKSMQPEPGQVQRTITSIRELIDIAGAMRVPMTICTVWPAAANPSVRGFLLPMEFNGIITELNEKIREAVAHTEVTLIFVEDLLSEDGINVRSEFAKDALHLNSRGNEILRKSILESIDAGSEVRG